MRNIVKKVALAVTGVMMSAAVASAQTVTFSTSGSFSGTGCAGLTCTFGGFTLSWQNAPSSSYLTPTTVDLGTFVTQATGGTQPITAIPNDVTFTLQVAQTAPTAGNSPNIVGMITGTLAFNPSQSTLTWMPAPGSFSIGDASYRLIVDNTGNINIAAPTVSQNPNPTIVKANVVVPEPSTYMLLGTGLAALGMVARRRRSNV